MQGSHTSRPRARSAGPAGQIAVRLERLSLLSDDVTRVGNSLIEFMPEHESER